MFKDLKTKMQAQFKQLVATGPLHFVELDRDEVWKTYLESIPEEKRQESTCGACKSFLRQFGGIVAIGADNKLKTLWDFEIPDGMDEYTATPAALRHYIASQKVAGPFLWEQKKCGTDRNPDPVKQLIWEHFFVELPQDCIRKKDSIPTLVGDARTTKEVLERGINEIKPDAVTTVLDLIDQGSLYRGAEFKGAVEAFLAVQKAGLKIPKALRSNYCWRESRTAGPAVSRIRSSAIGQLLQNLSEGSALCLDAAVGKFEAMVAPSNYKRPVALITPAMIKKAQDRLTELGLVGSLQRRQLSTRDLTVANALHVYRPEVRGKDLFAELTQATIVHPKTLSKVEEISIDDFLKKVLPKAKSVRALVENSHLSNLVALVGPAAPSPTLFRWPNNYSWSYSGDVADSIKERVKAAGGNVSGIIRASLSWGNHDDLDLHCSEPGYHIYFGNKGRLSPSGGMLDVDMNAGGGTTITPVENIFWQTLPRVQGEYELCVHQYRRDNGAYTDGFEVEIEYDGEVNSFAVAKNGPTGRNHRIAKFTYTKAHGFKLLGEGMAKGYPSRQKWGISTGQWHQVKAITLSPNHWTDRGVGNKHTFFLLDGCRADERVRGFYNEFLSEKLTEDRKVFEVLGSKVEVESVEDELSGLGFSETQRNHLFVEVDGSFKRQLQIKF